MYKHFPSRGQVSFCRQLHLGWPCVVSSDKIMLFCDNIMLAKLGRQLWLTWTLFLLDTFWNLLVFGKCLSKSFRKVYPIFICTLTLYSGLNYDLIKQAEKRIDKVKELKKDVMGESKAGKMLQDL